MREEHKGRYYVGYNSADDIDKQSPYNGNRLVTFYYKDVQATYNVTKKNGFKEDIC